MSYWTVKLPHLQDFVVHQRVQQKLNHHQQREDWQSVIWKRTYCFVFTVFSVFFRELRALRGSAETELQILHRYIRDLPWHTDMWLTCRQFHHHAGMGELPIRLPVRGYGAVSISISNSKLRKSFRMSILPKYESMILPALLHENHWPNVEIAT